MADLTQKSELQYDPEYFVVAANDFIRGRQRMTLREAQLFYIAVAQVVQEDKDFKTYTTTVPALAKFMGVSPQNLYRDLNDICKSLIQRYVEIKTGGDNSKRAWSLFNLVSRADFNGKTLTLRLSDDIKPFLLNLSSFYTQSRLKVLCSFSSYYAVRLYQLLVCDMGQSQGEKEVWSFSCDELREFFQVGKKQYALNRNLINKTIKVAIDEINTLDTMHIYDYEEIHTKGRGNPLTGVRFKAVSCLDKRCKEQFINEILPFSQKREKAFEQERKAYAEEFAVSAAK